MDYSNPRIYGGPNVKLLDGGSDWMNQISNRNRNGDDLGMPYGTQEETSDNGEK